MAISSQSVILGCALPAAAVVVVAAVYFYTRRKNKDDASENVNNQPLRNGDVSKATAINSATEVRKRDVKIKDVQKPDVGSLEKKHSVQKVDLKNKENERDLKAVDVVKTKENDENFINRETVNSNDAAPVLIEKRLKTSPNKTSSEHANKSANTEATVVRDTVKPANEGNVILEDLFESAKASMTSQEAPNTAPDDETLRAFMTSLMSKTEDAPAWSDQPPRTGSGDAPLAPSSLTVGEKKKGDSKRKTEKKKVDGDKKKKLATEVKEEEEALVEPERVEHDNFQRNHLDSTSEVSSDSGNGSGGLDRQSLTSPSNQVITCFQFEFPSRLCGKFVGKSGRNINQIKNASGCQITLLQHPYYNPDYQICTLDGTEDEVSCALNLIKEKFPQSKFSDITYQPFQVLGPETAHPVISPDLMELRLIAGIFNDVVISSVVDASQIFVQQPAHPTFPSLENLNLNMNACYNQDPTAPTIPTPLEAGVICAAPLMGGWYRAQIVAWGQDGPRMEIVPGNEVQVDVKFVDYGGYGRVPLSDLKQIRSDFMAIPFQSCECYLANVAPLEGESCISLEAGVVLEELTQGCVLQCEIVQYDEVTKVPYVYLYKVQGTQTLFVNRELVDRGVVRWLE